MRYGWVAGRRAIPVPSQTSPRTQNIQLFEVKDPTHGQMKGISVNPMRFLRYDPQIDLQIPSFDPQIDLQIPLPGLVLRWPPDPYIQTSDITWSRMRLI